MSGSAELAIEVPHEDGGAPPVPTPCQILDARLRPVGDEHESACLFAPLTQTAVGALR